jgi:hypothetical protein
VSAPTYTSQLRRSGSLWAARAAPNNNLEIGANHVGGIVRYQERVVIENADVDDLLAILWVEGSDAMKARLASEIGAAPHVNIMTEAERLVYAVAYATTVLHLRSQDDPDVPADVAFEAVKKLRTAPMVNSGSAAELLRVFKERP